MLVIYTLHWSLSLLSYLGAGVSVSVTFTIWRVWWRLLQDCLMVPRAVYGTVSGPLALAVTGASTLPRRDCNCQGQTPQHWVCAAWSTWESSGCVVEAWIWSRIHIFSCGKIPSHIWQNWDQGKHNDRSISARIFGNSCRSPNLQFTSAYVHVLLVGLPQGPVLKCESMVTCCSVKN